MTREDEEGEEEEEQTQEEEEEGEGDGLPWDLVEGSRSVVEAWVVSSSLHAAVVVVGVGVVGGEAAVSSAAASGRHGRRI